MLWIIFSAIVVLGIVWFLIGAWKARPNSCGTGGLFVVYCYYFPAAVIIAVGVIGLAIAGIVSLVKYIS